MKIVIRKILGFLHLFPFILLAKVYSLFRGREYAIERVGPRLTAFAKWIVYRLVPKISAPEQFNYFSKTLKKNFLSWKILYDMKVVVDNSSELKMNFFNCPFCDAAKKLGFPEFGPYICRGDWEVAKENSDKWKFSRKYQIGTGDTLCDHTYLRL